MHAYTSSSCYRAAPQKNNKKKKNIRADGWLAAPHFLCIGGKYRSSYFYRKKKKEFLLSSRLFVRSFFFLILSFSGGRVMQSTSDRSSGLFEIQPTSSAPISWRLTSKSTPSRAGHRAPDTLSVLTMYTREPVFDFNPHDV